MRKQYFINNTRLRQNYLKLPYNGRLKERARKLRKARNLPEVLFWMAVNKGKFHGLDFDRQRVIGDYIVDFYCKSLGLVIEIDWDSHIGKEVYDANREAWLKQQGCIVIRFSTDAVLKHMSQVLATLEEFILANYSG